MTAVRTILDPIPRPEDRWIKLAAAADILAMTKTTLRKLVSQGALQAFRVPSGELRFREADVLALLTPVPNAWNQYLAGVPVDPGMIREVVPVGTNEVVLVQPVPADPQPVPPLVVPVPADQAYPPGQAVARRWPAKEPADEAHSAPVPPSAPVDGHDDQDAAQGPAEAQDGDTGEATPDPEPVGTGTAYAQAVAEVLDATDAAEKWRGVL